MADRNILETLPAEDLDQIKKILTGYRDEGIADPVLPIDVDIDGDGVADGFKLGADGEVIFVPGVDLAGTVYVSEDVDAAPEVNG